MTRCLHRPLPAHDRLKLLELYTHCKDAKRVNNAALHRLPEERVELRAGNTGQIFAVNAWSYGADGEEGDFARMTAAECRREYFFKNLQTETLLPLKKQVQVMLLANIDVKQGLRNGARGVV